MYVNMCFENETLDSSKFIMQMINNKDIICYPYKGLLNSFHCKFYNIFLSIKKIIICILFAYKKYF